VKDMARIPLLFDFYGPLLTERQQELVRAYYLEDLSLGEIAESEAVSRQAVHDLIHRAAAALTEYEERLGFAAAHVQRQAELTALAADLEAAGSGTDPHLVLARDRLRRLLETPE